MDRIIGSDIVTLQNERLLNLLSMYLNDAPDSITTQDMQTLLEFGISVEQAFGMALAGLFSLDIADNPDDLAFYESYFPQMIHRFDAAQFTDDPYLQNIVFPVASIGSARFETQSYAPYEAFVCDDFHVQPDGRIIPQIGFFEHEFTYPTAMENGRIWMSVTPQEILTIAPAIERAHGKVLTYGLGLGYFAYMAARLPQVDSVTVVDRNPDIIQVFQQHILPQFDDPASVHVVQADAFEYAQQHMAAEQFDFVYTDLWHDVGDGLDLWLRMREFESLLPNAEFMYWIEPTMRCYL